MTTIPVGADELVDVFQVNAWTGIPLGTLRQWRHNGIGPVSFKVGRRIVYRRSVVESWLKQQEHATSSA